MTDKEKNFIKKINIDKAYIASKYSIILTCLSIATYIYPWLVYKASDFGIVFEIITLVFIFKARSCMINYDENGSKRYIILAMIPIGWLFIYDFIIIMSNVRNILDLAYLGYEFILCEIITIVNILLLLAINHDINKADNPEKFKESTDWFYERLREENGNKDEK